MLKTDKLEEEVQTLGMKIIKKQVVFRLPMPGLLITMEKPLELEESFQILSCLLYLGNG